MSVSASANSARWSDVVEQPSYTARQQSADAPANASRWRAATHAARRSNDASSDADGRSNGEPVHTGGQQSVGRVPENAGRRASFPHVRQLLSGNSGRLIDSTDAWNSRIKSSHAGRK